MHKLSQQRFRFRSKRESDAAGRTKEVRYDWVATSLHSFKKKCWSTLSNHTPVNLRSFKIRINFGFD
jgi:hypothetical protein